MRVVLHMLVMVVMYFIGKLLSHRVRRSDPVVARVIFSEPAVLTTGEGSACAHEGSTAPPPVPSVEASGRSKG